MLVNDFGAFAAAVQFDDLPGDVVEAVKLRVLDTLGAGIAGWRIGNHRPLLHLLEGGRAEATVWGDGIGLPTRSAALVNSFLAHSSYLDDGSRFTGGHPSSVVIPSTLALAERHAVSGRDLIAAVAIGYDVFLRLGRAIYPAVVDRGFQSTAVLGAVASAAAAASLLRLDADAAAHAIAIACSQGAGLKEALKASRSQPLQVGRSCEGGILAACFAAEGAEGAESIIENGLFRAFAGEGVDPHPVVDGLGREFRIGETYVKVHGGCRGVHAPVDAARELKAMHGLAPESIERIAIAVDSVTLRADIHHPKTGEEAQFSAPFAVAVAFLEGNASLFQYTDEKVADPRVKALMARTTVSADPDLDAVYPDRRGARVDVVDGQGRRFSHLVDNARGEPESPLDKAAIEEKFMVLAEPVLQGRARQLLERVATLETQQQTTPVVALASVGEKRWN